jgi:hypothetical protein
MPSSSRREVPLVQFGCKLHPNCTITGAVWMQTAPKLHHHRCNLDANCTLIARSPLAHRTIMLTSHRCPRLSQEDPGGTRRLQKAPGEPKIAQNGPRGQRMPQEAARRPKKPQKAPGGKSHTNTAGSFWVYLGPRVRSRLSCTATVSTAKAPQVHRTLKLPRVRQSLSQCIHWTMMAAPRVHHTLELPRVRPSLSQGTNGNVIAAPLCHPTLQLPQARDLGLALDPCWAETQAGLGTLAKLGPGAKPWARGRPHHRAGAGANTLT